MKKKLDKLFAFSKKHFAVIFSILAALIIVAVIVIAVSCGGDNASAKWGKGITSGVPMPSGIKAISVNVSENYAAAYFEDVTSEEVSDYITLIEEKCEVTFETDRFPCSAVCDDKIIAIHYNVTEKKLSVTVAAKGDNELSGDKQ